METDGLCDFLSLLLSYSQMTSALFSSIFMLTSTSYLQGWRLEGSSVL